jgi:cytochrome c
MLKKFLALSFIATACFACGSNDTNNQKSVSEKVDSAANNGVASDITQNPDYKKGLILLSGQDCLTCHKIDETSTGPAYRDVAKRYTNDETTLTTLANKIIKGGSGNWGQVPMTAHPNLSEDDAKQIVKYILLLKNK